MKGSAARQGLAAAAAKMQQSIFAHPNLVKSGEVRRCRVYRYFAITLLNPGRARTIVSSSTQKEIRKCPGP
jgi:hypothetical protein